MFYLKCTANNHPALHLCRFSSNWKKNLPFRNTGMQIESVFFFSSSLLFCNQNFDLRRKLWNEPIWTNELIFEMLRLFCSEGQAHRFYDFIFVRLNFHFIPGYSSIELYGYFILSQFSIGQCLHNADTNLVDGSISIYEYKCQKENNAVLPTFQKKIKTIYME